MSIVLFVPETCFQWQHLLYESCTKGLGDAKYLLATEYLEHKVGSILTVLGDGACKHGRTYNPLSEGGLK